MDARTVRQVRILDGMFYSFGMLEHHHQLMFNACSAIRAEKASAVPALSACWGFIDAIHRLRELAQATPGLGAKRIEVRRFMAATELAEDCRNYIQHLRQELSTGTPPVDPVWGSLSWVDRDDPHQAHTVILGTQLPGIHHQSAVFDRHEGRWVSTVCLTVGGRAFNFDPIFEEAQRFRAFVIPWLLEQNEALTVSNDLPIVTVRLVF